MQLNTIGEKFDFCSIQFAVITGNHTHFNKESTRNNFGVIGWCGDTNFRCNVGQRVYQECATSLLPGIILDNNFKIVAGTFLIKVGMVASDDRKLDRTKIKL